MRSHKHIPPFGPGGHPYETGLLSYTPAQLEKLQSKLAGTVQVPGAPGYNDDRMVFMHTYQSYPQLIIHCTCETDVIAGLKFARKRGLKVTCRSGGHSTAGYSSNDQIVLDISAINHVLIDREARTARVGAGTQFRKLNLMLHAAGLHVPGGGCETVCVAGYMMGGGYGFTSRLFGMNCDCVTAVTVILPDGRIVRGGEDSTDPLEQDIYWAVRGGTGNQFGVLVEIEYRLVQLGKLWGFGLRYELEDKAGVQTGARVLTELQQGYAETGPAKMGLQAMLMFMPSAAHPNGEKPALLIRGLYDGSEEECRAALGPLLAHVSAGHGEVELWENGSYLRLNEKLLQSVEPPGLDLPNVSLNTKPMVDGRILAEVMPPERWAEMIEHFKVAPDRTCCIAMEYYGGAVNEPAPDAMAYFHRKANLDLFSWAFWTFDVQQGPVMEWLDRFCDLAEAMGNGHRYQNYPRRGNENFRWDYFGPNFDRLLAIKQAVDPHNLFSFEQSITPDPRGQK